MSPLRGSLTPEGTKAGKMCIRPAATENTLKVNFTKQVQQCAKDRHGYSVMEGLQKAVLYCTAFSQAGPAVE